MKIEASKTTTDRLEQEGGTPYLKALIRAGWTIERVDGREVLEICENCQLPIFEGESYHYDDDGIYWHVDCEA